MANDPRDPTHSINPTPEQAQKLLHHDVKDGFCIINLHEYHDRAQYPANYTDRALPKDVSGREAYHRFLNAVEERFVRQMTGYKLITMPCAFVMIGPGSWHELVIGYYPNRAVLDMALAAPAMPGYKEVAVHREAGLKNVLTLAAYGDFGGLGGSH